MVRTPVAVRVARVVALTAGVLLCAAVALAAPKKPKTTDLSWTHPDFAALGVASIAMLPVTSYDHSLEAEKLVAQALGAALKGTGYRWISTSTVIELVRGDADAEALLRTARQSMVANERVDSLLAPPLCARLRTDAVLAVRIDQWEQRKLEWNEAGKPSTTARVRAALVDSLGRLLWTASGSELGEGPYQDPSVSPVGVTSTGLGMQPLTNQGGPPSYLEVLTRMFTRWTPLFPARPAPAPAPATP
jgi:hypothetical protein